MAVFGTSESSDAITGTCSLFHRLWVGVRVRAWVAVDQFGKAPFWLTADFWSLEEMRVLADRFGASVEGAFSDVVTKAELPSRFPGPIKRW